MFGEIGGFKDNLVARGQVQNVTQPKQYLSKGEGEGEGNASYYKFLLKTVIDPLLYLFISLSNLELPLRIALISTADSLASISK